MPDDWENVLSLAPEFTSLVADYVEAQQQQAALTEVPIAVRRALDLPLKLATELSHLERLAAQPMRPDHDHLLERATTLRARLTDRATLDAQAAQDAREVGSTDSRGSTKCRRA